MGDIQVIIIIIIMIKHLNFNQILREKVIMFMVTLQCKKALIEYFGSSRASQSFSKLQPLTDVLSKKFDISLKKSGTT